VSMLAAAVRRGRAVAGGRAPVSLRVPGQSAAGSQCGTGFFENHCRRTLRPTFDPSTFIVTRQPPRRES
jgi:hypothetical protein